MACRYVLLFQYMLPAIVHIMNQPELKRDDGPLVRCLVFKAD